MTVHKDTDVESCLVSLFQTCGVNANSSEIENVHFAGPVSRGNNRAIVVRFVNVKVKTALIQKRDIFKAKNITLTDDYPEEILERRRLPI